MFTDKLDKTSRKTEKIWVRPPGLQPSLCTIPPSGLQKLCKKFLKNSPPPKKKTLLKEMLNRLVLCIYTVLPHILLYSVKYSIQNIWPAVILRWEKQKILIWQISLSYNIILKNLLWLYLLCDNNTGIAYIFIKDLLVISFYES